MQGNAGGHPSKVCACVCDGKGARRAIKAAGSAAEAQRCTTRGGGCDAARRRRQKAAKANGNLFRSVPAVSKQGSGHVERLGRRGPKLGAGRRPAAGRAAEPGAQRAQRGGHAAGRLSSHSQATRCALQRACAGCRRGFKTLTTQTQQAQRRDHVDRWRLEREQAFPSAGESLLAAQYPASGNLVFWFPAGCPPVLPAAMCSAGPQAAPRRTQRVAAWLAYCKQ